MNTALGSATVRVPPLTTNLGQACYECFKAKRPDVVLQKCSGCFRVCYCGSACQKKNWPKHRTVCKALKAIESKYADEIMLPYTLLNTLDVTSDLELVNLAIRRVTSIEHAKLEKELNRELTVIERNMIGWQPRCLACGHSDVIARLEAAKNKTKPLLPSYHPCSKCGLSFACSEEHWNTVKSAHENEPCQDGWNGLSQCSVNQISATDTKMVDAESEFKWAPERTKAAWTSLRGMNWTDAFFSDLKKDMVKYAPNISDHVIEPLLRGATETLSMPMTILWALEVLNSDDAWTKKDTLNIHVIGAADIEILNANVMEEILHRLPEVKNLKITLCGPAMLKIAGSKSYSQDLETCPECSKNGRKRTQSIQPLKYHEFVASTVEGFVKPDLAVAFNSGCSQEEINSWKDTLAILATHKIPTVFTAYNRQEAIAEGKLIEAAGATLHPELGPKKNPWSSLLAKLEPSSVTGFYAINGWLAGGFN